MTLLFGNRTQVIELLVKCFTAQLCSRDKTHAVGAAPPNLLGSATCPPCVDIPFLASSSISIEINPRAYGLSPTKFVVPCISLISKQIGDVPP